MQKHDSKECKDHVKEKDVKSVIKKMGGSDAMFDEIKENGYGGAIKLSVCLKFVVMFIFSS